VTGLAQLVFGRSLCQLHLVIAQWLHGILDIYLQQVKSCRKYGLKEVVLTGIGGKSKPLREAGVLHVAAGGGKTKKILRYKLDERVGNTEKILLLSLRTIKDANIDILHHMDKSLDGISAPLLFLQDKDPTISGKKRATGKARDSRKFLTQQKRKRDRSNTCAVLLASSSRVARDYAGRGAAEETDDLLTPLRLRNGLRRRLDDSVTYLELDITRRSQPARLEERHAYLELLRGA
jgi:hypothetical protein